MLLIILGKVPTGPKFKLRGEIIPYSVVGSEYYHKIKNDKKFAVLNSSAGLLKMVNTHRGSVDEGVKEKDTGSSVRKPLRNTIVMKGQSTSTKQDEQSISPSYLTTFNTNSVSPKKSVYNYFDSNNNNTNNKRESFINIFPNINSEGSSNSTNINKIQTPSTIKHNINNPNNVHFQRNYTLLSNTKKEEVSDDQIESIFEFKKKIIQRNNVNYLFNNKYLILQSLQTYNLIHLHYIG